MSLCLQDMVDELVMKKNGSRIKKVSLTRIMAKTSPQHSHALRSHTLRTNVHHKLKNDRSEKCFPDNSITLTLAAKCQTLGPMLI